MPNPNPNPDPNPNPKPNPNPNQVFCQTRQMLDIVQAFVRASGYTYCRLDGTTQVAP